MQTIKNTIARWAGRSRVAVPRILPRIREQVRAMRRNRRTDVALHARLRLHGEEPQWCVVMDASRDGICLVGKRPVQPGTFADIEIRFEGRRLRTGIRVQWVDVQEDCVKIGARLLTAGDALLEDFAFYLARVEAKRLVA